MTRSLPNGQSDWPTIAMLTPLSGGPLMSMMQPAFAAAAEFNSKLYESAARFNAEWTQFLNRRLQEDLAIPQRLAACRSPQEAQQVWVDYWKTALGQYQDEMGRFAKMSETLAQQAAAAMRKHAEAMPEEMRPAA